MLITTECECVDTDSDLSDDILVTSIWLTFSLTNTFYFIVVCIEQGRTHDVRNLCMITYYVNSGKVDKHYIILF